MNLSEFFANSFPISSTSKLEKHPELPELAAYLRTLGIRSGHSTFAGSAAFCTETETDQMLYIIRQEDDKIDISGSYGILQPVHSIKGVHGYNIYFYPKVETAKNSKNFKVAKEEFASLQKQLLNDGYLMWDIDINNLGRLKDGTLVVIDRDSLVKAADCLTHDYGADRKPSNLNAAKRFLVSYSKVSIIHGDEMSQLVEKINHGAKTKNATSVLEAIKEFLDNILASCPTHKNIDYKGAQEAHINACGLTRGTITGAISDAELKAQHSGVSVTETTYAHVVKHYGLYKKQWSEIVKKAAARTDDVLFQKEFQLTGLCGMIRKTAADAAIMER